MNAPSRVFFTSSGCQRTSQVYQADSAGLAPCTNPRCRFARSRITCHTASGVWGCPDIASPIIQTPRWTTGTTANAASEYQGTRRSIRMAKQAGSTTCMPLHLTDPDRPARTALTSTPPQPRAVTAARMLQSASEVRNPSEKASREYER